MATKPNGGTTSTHARRAVSVSVGVGSIQLDRVPDEILAVADLSPSLRCPSCAYAAVTTLEFYTHLLQRHEMVSGMDAAFESRETFRAEEVSPRVCLTGIPRRATQRRKPRAVVYFDTGHLSEIFPEVIALSDVSDQDGGGALGYDVERDHGSVLGCEGDDFGSSINCGRDGGSVLGCDDDSVLGCDGGDALGYDAGDLCDCDGNDFLGRLLADDDACPRE